METTKPSPETGNDSDSQNETNYLASLSDLQFRESLDALLDGEGLIVGPASTSGRSPNTNRNPGVGSRPEEVVSDFARGASKGKARLEEPKPIQTTSIAPTGFLQPQAPNGPAISLSNHFAAVNSSARLNSVASSVASSISGSHNTKRRLDVSAVSEDEGEQARRRQDRNMREQQRSHQITHQIANLKSILRSADIQFKPDKYSTLTTVVDYIQSLKSRAQMLDAEHKKLLDTITKTSEIINNQYIPSSTSEQIASDLLMDNGSSPPHDESLACVQGLDYKAVFDSVHIPSSVATIDGRFVEVNKEFEEVSGCTRAELLPLIAQMKKGIHSSDEKRVTQNMSLFNVLSRGDMEQVFNAMSEMLKKPMLDGNAPPTDNWTGQVEMCRSQEKVRLTVNLVRTPQGRPRFFICLLVKAV